MGQGAYVLIANATQREATISYSNMQGMYNNGQEGSNFGPISGSIGGTSVLPGGPPQYIETDNFSSETASFDLIVSRGEETITFTISNPLSLFSVGALTQYQEQSDGDLNASVTIALGNAQAQILVMIT